MQNYHKHTSYSNIFIADSAASLKEYAKRAVELGHKVISSVEHYWQGYYYEAYELAKEYDLKFIFGAEAGWVKDRTSMIVQDVILSCWHEMKMEDKQLTTSYRKPI